MLVRYAMRGNAQNCVRCLRWLISQINKINLTIYRYVHAGHRMGKKPDVLSYLNYPHSDCNLTKVRCLNTINSALISYAWYAHGIYSGNFCQITVAMQRI